MTIQNDATVQVHVVASGNNVGLGLPRPQDTGTGANAQSRLNMLGGTLTCGTSSRNVPIFMQEAASSPGQVSVLNQTGGVINAWGGIQFGGAGTTRTGGLAAVTNSEGFLYIGARNGDGLKAGVNLPPTTQITLSGGTVGALESWSSPLPITLDTLNGNITIQCADVFSTPYNITLSGALSGPGGLKKTGAGQLALSGVNSYAGSTVLSNGVLQLTTSATASSNGPVTLDGSAGSPYLMLKISNQGHYWSVGTVTFASGSPTIDFQFGQVTPSATVGALRANGDLNFTAPPCVIITNASALGLGTYPLIQYSGTSSGATPTCLTLPGYCSGYLTNITATKTFALVITNSTFAPPLVWNVGNGAWDFSSFNWKQSGSPGALQYSDGKAVEFNDAAPGGPSITVTLSTTVSPFDRSFNNLTNTFTIAGSGSIAGTDGNLELLNGGTTTLATSNSYSGGTIISAGSRLNINNASAIGTGPLTLNANAKLGNLSGSALTLQTLNAQTWNGNFSYAGDGDFNTGPGAVTLAQNVTVNVVTNKLTIGGSINDAGQAKQLTKVGNGVLTLAADNTWSGLELQSGLLNFGSAGAAGSGTFTVTGDASIDNTSGGDMTLTAGSYHLSGIPANGTFTFLGTTNLNWGAGAVAANNSANIFFNIANHTFRTEGDIQGGNTVITKTGNGTWELAGFGAANSVVATVNQGQVDLARDGNPAIGTGGGGSAGGSHGLVVNSNAVARITGNSGNQIAQGIYVEVILNTGVLDLNGHDEAVDMISMTNGVLRNSAASTAPTLTIVGTAGAHPTNAITLNGPNSQFDVQAADASLNLNSIVNGNGTLVKTGLGTLTLQQSNSYTGNLTVSAGTLSLSYPDIAPNATVTVASGALLNLNFANSEPTLSLPWFSTELLNRKVFITPPPTPRSSPAAEACRWLR